MRARTLALCGLILLAGCNYGFRGGGGFPSSIRTVYVERFENQTVQFDLEDQIYLKLFDELPRRLGVRPATRENADAIVRGKITRYDDAAHNYRPGDAGMNAEILQRQVQIILSVEVVDTRRNLIIWESSSVTGNGEYNSNSQNDAAGQTKAIENLVQQILDGVQSQW